MAILAARASLAIGSVVTGACALAFGSLGTASAAPRATAAVRAAAPRIPDSGLAQAAVLRVFDRVELLTGRAYVARPGIEVLDASAWSERVAARFERRLPRATLEGLDALLHAMTILGDETALADAWRAYAVAPSGAFYDVERNVIVISLAATEPLRDHGEVVRAALFALRAAQLAPLEVPGATLTQDRVRALEALAEGEARYWTRRYGVRFAADLALEFVDAPRIELMHGDTAVAPAVVPAFVVAHTTFAASAGEAFVEAVLDAGGPVALERAWRLPPRSTEQIVWPGKWQDIEAVDEPHAIVARDVADLLGANFTLRFEAELGAAGAELVLRLAGDPLRALVAQRGFGGDRIRLYENPSGQRVVQWVLAGDTNADAIELFDAARKVLERLYAPTQDAANRVLVDGAQSAARATTLAGEVLGIAARKDDKVALFTGLQPHVDSERLVLRVLE